jgi:polyhydroxyalkanoate synthesis regulator phasin
MAVETVRELIREVEKAEAEAEKFHEEMNEIPEDTRELVRSDLVNIAEVLVREHGMSIEKARRFIREMLSVSA